jgi:hypothetical protein
VSLYLWCSYKLNSCQPTVNTPVHVPPNITYVHKNSNGPKTLPCGTSEVTLTSLDSYQPNGTLCVRPTVSSLTQTTTLQSTLQATISVSSRSWRTKPKAFDTSIIATSTPTLYPKQSAMSWHTVMTWHSPQYHNLNTRCPTYNRSFLSQTCLKYPAKTCSSYLQITEVKLIGL